MTKLLPGGFGQLLPIVEVIISLHVEYIEKAARGTLASGSDAPSEEQALESVLRMFEGRHLEADKRALEEFMAARTWEWWQGYPERRLFSALLVRADLRKKKRWTGNGDDRRRPTREEGLRIARPLLAGIPDEITLDAEGEYEPSVARLLAMPSCRLRPWARALPRGRSAEVHRARQGLACIRRCRRALLRGA